MHDQRCCRPLKGSQHPYSGIGLGGRSSVLIVGGRQIVVERRRLAPRRPAPDPIAEIRAAVEALCDVPRESLASMPDMLFHNRRVAKRITEAADRIENFSMDAARLPPPPRIAQDRDRCREIVTRRGRRVRVLERGAARQMELGL